MHLQLSLERCVVRAGAEVLRAMHVGQLFDATDVYHLSTAQPDNWLFYFLSIAIAERHWSDLSRINVGRAFAGRITLLQIIFSFNVSSKLLGRGKLLCKTNEPLPSVQNYGAGETQRKPTSWL
jgi:hypothetical protein